MTNPARDLSLSLVSHTNVGKTTLARTLLRRDVGEVRDAPHVTAFADMHPMLETDQGERLLLWDTPGFGDSARLVRRLRQASNPIGWFMSQVWDRWRDRAFWSSQQAVRNVREHADVMLYLVNAAETPESAGYVAAEMELLAWVGKPVVVLLNQLGAPRAAALEEAEAARWRRHLDRWAFVREVLPFDAFARCWVQERVLLRAVEHALDDAGRRARMARLAAAWATQRRLTFNAAMQALSVGLARTALDAEPIAEGGRLRATLRSAGAALGVVDAETGPMVDAQKALAVRLDAEVRAGTEELVRMHGLSGDAPGEILTRVAAHYRVQLRVDEKGAAIWGGAITGALMGLKADLLSGGLTLGGGLLAGGLLGALGAAGLARGINIARGTERSWVSWSPEALNAMLQAALLRYLAVAHFGRGRGDWVQGESPPHWAEVVEAAVASRCDALAGVWSGRPLPGAGGDPEALAGRIAPPLRAAAIEALSRLYPVAREIFDDVAPPSQRAFDE